MRPGKRPSSTSATSVADPTPPGDPGQDAHQALVRALLCERFGAVPPPPVDRRESAPATSVSSPHARRDSR